MDFTPQHHTDTFNISAPDVHPPANPRIAIVRARGAKEHNLKMLVDIPANSLSRHDGLSGRVASPRWH